MTGKALIFSAPSGSGKTTLVRYLLEQDLNLEFSVSATSRSPRSNEIDGKDYYFLSVAEFQNKIADGEFIEWEEVYKDHFYGTLKSELERIWSAGKHVIFDVDVNGGLNLKKTFGKKALAVFIQPPSIEVLEQRLRNRGTDAEDIMRHRIARAAKELKSASDFDVIIINDILEQAKSEAKTTVLEFLSS